MREKIVAPVGFKRLWILLLQRYLEMAFSLWQNGPVERLIGSIRRESLDHLIVFGEEHLRSVLKAYASYYNEVRTHLSLDKDAPHFRRRQKTGRIAAIPILGVLHHQYVRV
jgi:transposase InsO family protein